MPAAILMLSFSRCLSPSAVPSSAPPSSPAPQPDTRVSLSSISFLHQGLKVELTDSWDLRQSSEEKNGGGPENQRTERFTVPMTGLLCSHSSLLWLSLYMHVCAEACTHTHLISREVA